MKQWVWYIGLASIASLSIMACSFGSSDTAGSSFETENSIAVNVTLADGSPAARMSVRVRPSDYIGIDGVTYLSTSRFVYDSTYSKGNIVIRRLSQGDYRIEVGNDSLKCTNEFKFARQSDDVVQSDTMDLKVTKPGRISGQVELLSGQEYAVVAVAGTELVVRTDSLGNYTIDGVPEGKFEVRALNAEKEILGDQSIKVVSGKKSENVDFELPPDVKDSIEDVDTVEVYPIYVLDDFEKGANDWYITNSQYYKSSIKSEYDETRESWVVHYEFQNDSNFGWSGMGRYVGNDGYLAFSDMDSVSFYAKGSGKMSISFDYLVGEGVSTGDVTDSASREESAKAWAHIDLTDEWERYVVTLDDFVSPEDSNGGNIGWDAIKGKISNITIFGNPGEVEGKEFWIDEVTLYGLKEELFKPKESDKESSSSSSAKKE
mgnify:FL=1